MSTLDRDSDAKADSSLLSDDGSVGGRGEHRLTAEVSLAEHSRFVELARPPPDGRADESHISPELGRLESQNVLRPSGAHRSLQRVARRAFIVAFAHDSKR